MCSTGSPEKGVDNFACVGRAFVVCLDCFCCLLCLVVAFLLHGRCLHKACMSLQKWGLSPLWKSRLCNPHPLRARIATLGHISDMIKFTPLVYWNRRSCESH